MITSLASYKGFIGYTSSDRDAAYSYILSAMSAAIKRRVKVQLEQATYTVIVTPPASQELVLKQVPVSSITSIHLNPDAGGQSANFTSDYLLDSPCTTSMPSRPCWATTHAQWPSITAARRSHGRPRWRSRGM